MLEFLLGLAIGAWVGVAGALWRRWLPMLRRRRSRFAPDGIPTGVELDHGGVRVMAVDEIESQLAKDPRFKTMHAEERRAAANRIHLLARRRLPHILARSRR